jgi:hypothetical protein
MVLRIYLGVTKIYPAISLQHSGYANGSKFYLSLGIAPAIIWNLVLPTTFGGI